jgi:DNA replication protein DnaC
MTRGEMDARLEAEYQNKRADAQRLRSAREDEVVERDPEIGRLRGSLYARFQASARKALAGPEVARAGVEALRGAIAHTQREVADRLRALGLPEDYLDLRYECADCGDTGWLDDYHRASCACRARREAQLAMEDAGGRPPWRGFDAFDEGIYPTQAQKNQGRAARALCEAYADRFPETEKPNLLLMGESGLGKTFLLEAIAERVSARRLPVLSVSGFRMLEAMRAYHFGQPGEGASFRRMVDCDLLLIDDLGTEPMLNNITIEYLFTLLGERCAARRHTVVATNLLPGDLMQRYGERVMSRLLDTRLCSAIRLTGADLRLTGGAKG